MHEQSERPYTFASVADGPRPFSRTARHRRKAWDEHRHTSSAPPIGPGCLHPKIECHAAIIVQRHHAAIKTASQHPPAVLLLDRRLNHAWWRPCSLLASTMPAARPPTARTRRQRKSSAKRQSDHADSIRPPPPPVRHVATNKAPVTPPPEQAVSSQARRHNQQHVAGKAVPWACTACPAQTAQRQHDRVRNAAAGPGTRPRPARTAAPCAPRNRSGKGIIRRIHPAEIAEFR